MKISNCCGVKAPEGKKAYEVYQICPLCKQDCTYVEATPMSEEDQESQAALRLHNDKLYNRKTGEPYGNENNY